MTAIFDWHVLLAVVVGYLAGTIPFGLLLTRLAGLGDIRAIGSGNIGATNVLRTGNKALAVATFLGDGLKGTFAALVGWKLAGEVGAVAAGGAAIFGHIFPVWLGFRGGKAVATYLGATLGVAWPAAIVFAFVWLVCAVATRYSSLSALAATLATPLAMIFAADWNTAIAFALLSAVLWWRHAGNIRRLATGSESKIGSRA